MKKLYTLLFLITAVSLNAQTTINYVQQAANYDAFFTDGGGNYDSGTDQFGMWANFDAKQSVAFRNFTETGLPGGTASTMAIGDSFSITLNATRAYGVIGIALLSGPTATTTWADRHNNYAVQINMNGESGGSYDPLEVVSNGGTIDISSISGSTTYADFKFKFTLLTSTTMEVSLNDGAEIFNVTLNNQNITGYSVYIADDWNGSDNADIFWKPTTEYIYAISLDNKEFSAKNILSLYPNPTSSSFKLNNTVNDLKIYDMTGKMVKSFNGNFKKGFTFNVSNLNQGIYIIKIKNELGQLLNSKLIKL